MEMERGGMEVERGAKMEVERGGKEVERKRWRWRREGWGRQGERYRSGGGGTEVERGHMEMGRDLGRQLGRAREGEVGR